MCSYLYHFCKNFLNEKSDLIKPKKSSYSEDLNSMEISGEEDWQTRTAATPSPLACRLG